jgi:hypothetical protein
MGPRNTFFPPLDNENAVESNCRARHATAAKHPGAECRGNRFLQISKQKFKINNRTEVPGNYQVLNGTITLSKI